jgi:hypothetical protein
VVVTVKIDMEWVQEGQKFAGGSLTRAGAAEVNGNRLKVVAGEKPTVTIRVLDALGNIKAVTPYDILEAQRLLKSTPW